MIEMLKDRLYQADRDKDKLTRALQEAQQLVNQQQQLSLQANKKIGVLELQLKEIAGEESKQANNKKWYDIFKRKK